MAPLDECSYGEGKPYAHLWIAGRTGFICRRETHEQWPVFRARPARLAEQSNNNDAASLGAGTEFLELYGLSLVYYSLPSLRMRFSHPIRILGFFAALSAVFILVSYTLFEHLTPVNHHPANGSEKSIAPDQNRDNPWADLSVAEIRALLDYLHTVPNNLNLSFGPSESRFRNFVLRVELLRPNKTQALRYIDDRSQVKPPRWATVLVYSGTESDATLDEYAVGPLPPSPETEIRPLTQYYNSGKSSSPNLIPDAESVRDWPYLIAEEISDITKSILGGVINSGNRSSPNGLEIGFRDAWIDSNGRTVRWCEFQRAGLEWESRTLLPQGLYFKIDTTGRDPETWRVLQWYYNNVLYNSTEAFRNAWMTPGFVVTPLNLDGEWTHIDSLDGYSTQAPSDLEPVTTSSKQGFEIDKKHKFVSWKGFEFYIAFTGATGLTLYDIRFQGERIIYELGLQEALSQYAGSDPVQGAAKFLDSFWGMGARMFELVPGTLQPHPAYAA